MNRPKGLFKIASLTFSAASILLLPGTANATITFQYSQTAGVDVYQQTNNNPCVIGDPSCKEPAGMVYTKVSGSPGDTYDLWSPVYLAAASFNFGTGGIPLSFIVGVDDNFSNIAEHLVAFDTYTCSGPVGAANLSETTGLPCAGSALDQANSWNSSTSGWSLKDMSLSDNGNGYSNFILKGFSLTAGNFYAFRAIVQDDNDGFEEFFIIPAGSPPAVPEPVTSALVGTGLVALFYVRRRASR